MTASAESMAMNRQALPSIILSVATVCFFAVAFYHREAEPRRGATRRENLPGPAGSGPGTGLARSVVARPVGSQAAQKSVSRPAEGRFSSATQGNDDERKRDLVNSSGREVATRDGEAGRNQRLGPPSTPILTASDRNAGDEPARPARPSAGDSESRRAVTLSRSPFTVAAAGETIADVSRRVYGSTDQAELLWRANRDLLRERDTPIAPGTVLRTPGPSRR